MNPLKLLWDSTGLNYIFDPNLNSFILLFINVVILIIAIYNIHKYLVKIFPACENNLDKGIKYLSSIEKDEINNNFEEINETIKSIEMIDDLWKEYSHTILKVQLNDGRHELIATTDAAVFFNEGTILSGYCKIGFLKSVPGVFTGLGIFGTFAGLAVGIYGVNLGSNNLEIMKEGIRVLLSGMGTAFATSFWGLLFALSFTIYERRKSPKIISRIEQLQNICNNLFARKTSEHWYYDQLTEMQKQTKELQVFNSDLAISIGEAIDSKMGSRFEPVFENLLNAIHELTHSGMTAITDNINENIGGQLTSFATTLVNLQEKMDQSLSENQMRIKEHSVFFENAMQTASDGIKESMDTVCQQQAQMGEEMEKRMDGILDKFASSMEGFNENISSIGKITSEQLQAATEKFNSILSDITDKQKGVYDNFINSFNNITVKANEMTDRLIAGIDSGKNMLAQAAETAEIFRNAAEPIMETSSEMKKAADTIESTLDNLTKNIWEFEKEVSSFFKVLHKDTELMQQNLDKTKETWSVYEKQFTGVKNDLESVFTTLSLGLLEYRTNVADNVKDYLTNLDGYTSKALRSMSATIEDLRDAADSIDEALRQKK